MSSRCIIREHEVHSLLENQQWESFCYLYATDIECLGNGTLSYLRAYGIDSTEKNARKSAGVMAARLLKNVIILKRIDLILNSLTLNNVTADAQLAFVIAQDADFHAKIAAIREYNALRGRIRKKLDMEVSQLSDAELNEEGRRIDQELAQYGESLQSSL